MNERNTTALAESTPEQTAQADAPGVEVSAFARGSGPLSDVSAAAERTEHSVMEGLPPAKAERIAAMRRELAELQRQLTEAQQRIAIELQGRAEDAERVEVLEARLHAADAKAEQDATSAAELVTEVESLRSQLATVSVTAEGLRRAAAVHDVRIDELATRTAELATEQATRSRLERELDDERTQRLELTGQLETQLASLRDTKGLITALHAEHTAMTSERDALKGELAAARAKLQDVANQLTRFGQSLIDGGEASLTHANSEPTSAVASRSAERSKPPPVPPPRAATPTQPQNVETILEVTAEAKSGSRVGLGLIGGVIVGCVATIAVVKWSGSSTTHADERQDYAAPSSERASGPASLSATPVQARAVPGAPSDHSTSTDVAARPSDDSASHAAAPAEITPDGVIVLPQVAEGHRVFVDGRVVAVKSSRAVVPCGTREIRIGSRGAAQKLDVACGGETVVPSDAPGSPNGP